MLDTELIKKLRETEETLLLEILGVTSDELVDAFLDKIEEREAFLNKYYGQDE